jgi:hypothetical protein
MFKKLILITTILLGGCSSQPQAPVVINIAPSFPPQYFPNSGGNNRNIGNSYEETNNIQEINLEEEGEDEINYEE